MKVIIKETGEEKVFTTRKSVLINLLAPIKDDFSLVSNALKETIKKYEDEPLVPYVMTKAEEQMVKENPDALMDIPRFYVKGFDEAVGDSRFDQKICDEFYERWTACDKKIYEFINKKNPTYRIEF